MDWQKIETAPKGGGAELTSDPNWVKPPEILLLCADGHMVVGRWEWYYAEGGAGWMGDVSAWSDSINGEQIARHYGEPTHWMPLPKPPKERRE